MLKILKDRWDENKDRLEVKLSCIDMDDLDYASLVKLTFETIYNESAVEKEYPYERLNLNRVSVIDDGAYQGTLLFVIPFESYQPSEYMYLMTYVGYGSCSGCDILQAITGYDSGLPGDTQRRELLSLCKDIVVNTIKPYNYGWRNEEDFDPVEE